MADALRSHLPESIPLVLSHLDKRANLRSHTRPASNFATAPPSTEHAPSAGEKGKAPAADRREEGGGEEVPADAAEPLAFDLEPSVPAPPTTVPRPTARYQLPPGVDDVDQCALVWIGGESLALNNLLLTHGRCRVRPSRPLYPPLFARGLPDSQEAVFSCSLLT